MSAARCAGVGCLLLVATCLIPPVVRGGPGQADGVRLRELVNELQSLEPGRRHVAATELLRLGPRAAPAAADLARLLRDEADVAPAIGLVLVQIGEPAVAPLTDLLAEPAARAGPLCVLSLIGPPARAAAPKVAALVKGDDHAVASLAAYTLARISPADRPSAVAALERLAARRDPRGDFDALLLAWLGHDADVARDLLVNQLRSQSCMLGEFNRLMGAYGLVELGPAARPAAAELRAALADPEPLVRVLAAHALARVSPPDRARARAVLAEVARTKPEPPAREAESIRRATSAATRAERELNTACLDVLATLTPTSRFPASEVLAWARQLMTREPEAAHAWAQDHPLSTTLAAAALRRLDEEAVPNGPP